MFAVEWKKNMVKLIKALNRDFIRMIDSYNIVRGGIRIFRENSIYFNMSWHVSLRIHHIWASWTFVQMIVWFAYQNHYKKHCRKMGIKPQFYVINPYLECKNPTKFLWFFSSLTSEKKTWNFSHSNVVAHLMQRLVLITL